MPISSTDAFSLENYGYNLTRLAREGDIPPLAGYDTVVTRIFAVLLRPGNRSNSMLIDEDEPRRWQIMMEVLRRVAAGDVPEPLQTCQVIAPNFAALCGASPPAVQPELTGTASEIEAQLTHLLAWPSQERWHSADSVLPTFEAFFSAARRTEHQVLLLNDFHRLIGGEPHPYALDLAPLLVSALARNEIQLLGTSTLEQYRHYIERDAAIARRFQAVMLKSDLEIL